MSGRVPSFPSLNGKNIVLQCCIIMHLWKEYGNGSVVIKFFFNNLTLSGIYIKYTTNIVFEYKHKIKYMKNKDKKRS